MYVLFTVLKLCLRIDSSICRMENFFNQYQMLIRPLLMLACSACCDIFFHNKSKEKLSWAFFAFLLQEKLLWKINICLLFLWVGEWGESWYFVLFIPRQISFKYWLFPFRKKILIWFLLKRKRWEIKERLEMLEDGYLRNVW